MVKGYRVFNKAGDIGIAYADAGLIDDLSENTHAAYELGLSTVQLRCPQLNHRGTRVEDFLRLGADTASDAHRFEYLLNAAAIASPEQLAQVMQRGKQSLSPSRLDALHEHVPAVRAIVQPARV